MVNIDKFFSGKAGLLTKHLKRCKKEKGVVMSRTNKRDYTGAKRFDVSCRNHGGCEYCVSNRMRQDRVNRRAADAELHCWKTFGVDPDTVMHEEVDLQEAEARVTEDLHLDVKRSLFGIGSKN